jgi:hypothetical protein
MDCCKGTTTKTAAKTEKKSHTDKADAKGTN